jgi:ferric-dicitrate binding protein FerR (iron transport regulator)
LVDLVIRDTASRRGACAAQARVSSRVLGLLRGNARGRFRTTGRFAAATVRGTEWGVRDRCDGTLVVDTRGSVAVRDFRRGKTIVLHAGQTYLASAS